MVAMAEDTGCRMKTRFLASLLSIASSSYSNSLQFILGFEEVVELEFVGKIEQIDDIAVGEDEFGRLDGSDEIFDAEFEGLAEYH